MKWLILCVALLAYASDGVEDEVAELHKHSAEALKKLEGISFAQHGEKFEKVKFKVMNLASDDKFIKAVTDLWSHPNRNTSLVAQGVFFLFMLFFKAWRQSRARNWFTKILTGLVLSLFTWGMLIYVIPAIVIGEPFRIIAAKLWFILTS